MASLPIKYKKNNRYHPCISRQTTGAWIYGVEAFQTRLSELVKEDVDENGKPYQLDSLFEFDVSSMAVTVPMRDSDGVSLIRCAISPALQHGGKKVIFETDAGRTFSNLFDVLQEISDTFEWILSEHR